MGKKTALIIALLTLSLLAGALAVEPVMKVLEFLELVTSFSVFYYVVLFLYLISIYKFRLNSKFTLLLAIYLIAIGGGFASFGFISFSEPILRTSLTFWLIGLVQTFANRTKKGTFRE